MFRKKQGKIISLLLVMIFLLTACAGAKGEMVATVDGDGITKEEFKKDFDSYKSIYEQQFGEGVLEQEIQEGVTLRDSLRDEVLNKLIMEKLISKDAEKRKISYTDEELKKQKNMYIEGFGGEEQFNNYLKENGLEKADFDKDMEKMLINEKHKEKVMSEIEVSDDKAKKFFEENKEELIKVKASHILVESEQEAKDIKKKLNEGGDFAKIAEEKSIDTSSAVEGGDLGFFPKGQMITEFEDVAFELKAGEVSEPVKTDVGYHIIKLVERKDTFESLVEEIKEQLKEEEYVNVIEELKENAKIEVNEKNLEFIEEEAKKAKEEKKEEEKQEDKQEEKKEEPKEDKKEEKKENK